MQLNPKYILDSGVLCPSSGTQVQQVGIDLTLKTTTLFPHGLAVNVDLNEEVYLPNDVFALFFHRSSYNRKGILITGSVYDPGYKGQVGCTVYNLSGETIEIRAGERIGQMVFFKADPASSYNGQWQGEKLTSQ